MRDRTVADFLLDRLRAWGVKQVFVYRGDGIKTKAQEFLPHSRS